MLQNVMQDLGVACFDCGNYSSGSIKGGDVDEPRYSFLKKDSVPWSFYTHKNSLSLYLQIIHSMTWLSYFCYSIMCYLKP